MIIKPKAFWLTLVLLFSLSAVKAQLCKGALGDPVIDINFGSGSSTIGPPISETNYLYKAGIPEDGQYTIVNTTAGLNGGWHQNVTNHTPGSPNGYFMVVNADYTQGIFYQTTVSNLCPNTTYEFAAWIINILKNPGIRPNIRFTIENDGVLVSQFSTEDIVEGTAADWKKYGTQFITPSHLGVFTLKMTNINPGGIGNDLALDDITFRACGPEIKPFINNNATSVNLCAGQAATYNLGATVSAGYNNPVYQWQVLAGTTWQNLPGKISTQTTVKFTNAIAGTYQYRLTVIERANQGSPNCGITSPILTINVSPNPNPVASYTGNACIGSDIQLNVNEGNTFLWTGPGGFSSTEQNPILKNITVNQSGIYKVTSTNAAGCSATSEIQLKILPPVLATTNVVNGITSICEGKSIALIAAGGTTYHWLPIAGLSDPNIANPVASPTDTTTYTVTVGNGNCTSTATIVINVLKNAKADAGDDKKLLFGQSTNLNGKATGDHISYSWSPSTYLDDPTKLNPIASPPTDQLYTLTVTSACNTSTDQVFVKVYPKIEIQNTFTPNGDGVNDTWNIPALQAFPAPEVKVVNRSGQLVFNNRGSYRAWDGKLNHKDVPVGVYYYTIYLNEDFKPLNGWLFLTR
ncbi:MAG: gliding motility-associated C-terminal domain-containing protein [Bacteroidota bacterium]